MLTDRVFAKTLQTRPPCRLVFIHGTGCQDVAESRPASISMELGCVLTDRVFAKTLQTRPPGHPAAKTLQPAGHPDDVHARYTVEAAIKRTPLPIPRSSHR